MYKKILFLIIFISLLAGSGFAKGDKGAQQLINNAENSERAASRKIKGSSDRTTYENGRKFLQKAKKAYRKGKYRHAKGYAKSAIKYFDRIGTGNYSDDRKSDRNDRKDDRKWNRDKRDRNKRRDRDKYEKENRRYEEDNRRSDNKFNQYNSKIDQIIKDIQILKNEKPRNARKQARLIRKIESSFNNAIRSLEKAKKGLRDLKKAQIKERKRRRPKPKRDRKRKKGKRRLIINF